MSTPNFELRDIKLPTLADLITDGKLPMGPVCPWPKDLELEEAGFTNIELNIQMNHPEVLSMPVQEINGSDIIFKNPGTEIDNEINKEPSMPNFKSSKASTEPTIKVIHDTAVKASIADMAKGLFKNAQYAIKDGRVHPDIREERYNICKQCPHFIEASKRCSECGCFMEAKTWLGSDPKYLCPKNKWSR